MVKIRVDRISVIKTVISFLIALSFILPNTVVQADVQNNNIIFDKGLDAKTKSIYNVLSTL